MDTEQPDKTMAIVPTLDWMLEVDERLVTLEGEQPAGGTSGRLDRHRAELEAIKRTLNELIRYVVQSSADPRAVPPEMTAAPTIAAPTPEEDYQ